MNDLWLRLSQVRNVLPLVALIVACGSLFVAYQSAIDANRAREIENQHFQQLTAPHILEQQTRDRLDVLDRMMSRAELWVHALEERGEDVSNLSSGLAHAGSLRIRAESHFINARFSDADIDIQQAADLAVRILESRLDADFSPMIITVSGTAILGIDMDPRTIGKTSDGSPLQAITISAYGAPPTADEYIVVSAYDFMPYGATFDRPITVKVNYDSANIPQGIEERRLILASWSNDSQTWTRIRRSSIDVDSNIMAGKISRLSPVAVLAEPPGQMSVTNRWPYIIAGVIMAVSVIAVILRAFITTPKKKRSVGFRSGS